MRAVVIYDSRHGSTAHVAEAIVRGLRSVDGIEATIGYAPSVHSDLLEEADLLVIGGPTEYLHASAHVREFFGRMGGFDLHGKFGFAFDTHAGRPLTGSAARYIEKELRLLGVTLLEPRQSAITVLDGASHAVTLAAGVVARFEGVGAELGRALVEARSEGRTPPTGPAAPPSP